MADYKIETQLEKYTRQAKRRLYENAACKDKPPHLFDATEHNNIYTDMALIICQFCPVQEECLFVVNPENSLYDGIAGGQVFSNGRIVDRYTEEQQRQSAKPKLRKLSK